MSVTNPQRWQYDEDLESKYEIIDVLGGGGMGRVLRARHRQLKRLVAIKLLQHDLRASEAVTRFLREARAAAQIRSVHVAHVMDAGLLRSGQPYIVMEYLQGQDLANMVAIRGRLPVEQAVGFVLQALEAIAEAHLLGIIHRDIKPGNLFATRSLGGETSIKVVDFGLAKTSCALDTLDPGVTERGAVLGTPSYMSPEQFVDAQDVDVRADIWGIGATLFELLAGTPPFTGTALPQIYTAVMHQPIPGIGRAVPDLPEGLQKVVATCLTRERDKRYANVAELAEALEPYAAESSRESVSRIRRIVLEGRQSMALADSNDLETPNEFAAGSGTPIPQSGLFSSTFARGQKSSRPAAAPRHRLRWIGFALLAPLLAGAAAWTLVTRHSAPVPVPEVHAKPVRALNLDQPAATHVEPPHEAPTAGVTQLPLKSEVSTSIAPAAEPKDESVSRPTAKRSRKAKVPAGVAGTPAAASIYEQYP
jgi:eukaryotic-like serine/threonine-protein kinase